MGGLALSHCAAILCVHLFHSLMTMFEKFNSCFPVIVPSRTVFENWVICFLNYAAVVAAILSIPIIPSL